MLEAKCLKKAVVPSTLIENPSPGSIQCTRLALHVGQDSRSCFVYIASASHIYKLQIALGESSVGKGKDSLLIPEHTEIIASSLVNRCPHRSEIQSIVLVEAESHGNLLLGSVDSYGHLIVSKLDASGKDVDRLTYSALPPDNGIGEGSWSGLCFSPNQWSMAAVARSFCKTIDIYDQDIHIRTLRPLWYPTSLNFMQNVVNGNQSSMLAITEGSQLTMWDLRMKENGGCLHRICGIPGDILYSVCSSSTGNIAVGGVDRTVTIYDPRRWTALSNWNPPPSLAWDTLSHSSSLSGSMNRPYTMASPSQSTNSTLSSSLHSRPQAYLTGSDQIRVQSRGDQAWYPDSGATNHVTHNPSNLLDSISLPGSDQVVLGNGQGHV